MLLFSFSALFFTVAWVARAEPAVPAILVVAGLLMAMLGYSFQDLTVCDEGDRRAIWFGPLPLFKRRIPYDDIIGVEIGRTTIMDGWGIHWSPWGGSVWSLRTGRCVAIRRRQGVIRVGRRCRAIGRIPEDPDPQLRQSSNVMLVTIIEGDLLDQDVDMIITD